MAGWKRLDYMQNVEKRMHYFRFITQRKTCVKSFIDSIAAMPNVRKNRGVRHAF